MAIKVKNTREKTRLRISLQKYVLLIKLLKFLLLVVTFGRYLYNTIFIRFHVSTKILSDELNPKIAQVAPVGKPQRCTLANVAPSNSHANELILKATSIPTQAKGRQFKNETRERSVKTFDYITSHQTPTKLNDHHLPTKGMLSVPAPLATKIFYSQRTQRLRSAISNMYYRTSSTQLDDGLSNMQFSDSDKIPSTNGYFHHKQIDDQLEKIGKHVLYMVEDTDPIPSKSSEADSDESRRSLPSNFPDQFYVNNAFGPQRTIGNLASDNLPAPLPSDEN